MIVDRILLKISIKQLNNVVQLDFSVESLVTDSKMSYICNVFFIVLDLRLMKIGCRETTFSFLYHSPLISLSFSVIILFEIHDVFSTVRL